MQLDKKKLNKSPFRIYEVVIVCGACPTIQYKLKKKKKFDQHLLSMLSLIY